MTQLTWQQLLNSAEEGPEPIPDGIYDIVVESAQGKAASSGKPMVVALMKVVTGPYAGKKVWNNFVLTQDNPNALGYFFKHMAAFGIDQSMIAQLAPPDQGGMDQLAQMLIGKYATISVGHREWQGQTRNQVGDVKPYAGGQAPNGAAPPAAPQAPPVPQAPVPQPQPQPQAAPPPIPQPPVPPAAPPQPTAPDQQPPFPAPPAPPF